MASPRACSRPSDYSHWQGQWTWTLEHDTAFEELKALVAADILMSYPNHNLPFDIYTDASDYQCGACIMQERGRPVAYYSKKLTSTQQNYTTMEKELLSIVLTLAEFWSMLLGARLTIYTDHKNLTYSTLNNSRVLRWRLFLEEYNATYVYIEGKDNVLADAFSRLPRKDMEVDDARSPMDTPIEDQLFSSLLNDSLLAECFVNFPADNMHNPLDLAWLQQHQFEDHELNAQHQQHPHTFPIKYVNQCPLICY